MTGFTSDADIDRIGRGLLDRSLPKAEWTHEAHFAAALFVLARCPDLDAARDMPRLIRAYNAATGVANTDTGGYHETITQASLRGARACLAASPAAPLWVVCRELMASPLGRPDWLLAYWRPETLFSAVARRRWVAPDRLILPF